VSDPQDGPGHEAAGETKPPLTGHPALSFDEIVHQRTRLGILAVLAEAGQADFPYLRGVLGLTDGNLGRHLQILADAGLITISKGYHRRRPRTWATITSAGRHGLDTELASMRALISLLHAPAYSPASSAAQSAGRTRSEQDEPTQQRPVKPE
jgi:DNA-binding MarR family transcriptional regulator